MIRIAKNRSGYSGYTCVGIATLKDPIKLNRMVADTIMDRTEFEDSYESETDPPFKYHLIDNYLNLPERVTGSVTEVEIIEDMSGLDWSPETACWRHDGLLDLLSNYGDLVVFNSGGTAWNPVVSTVDDFNPTYNLQYELTGGLELYMHPGMLEPVLHVDLPATAPAAVVSPDLALDGLTLALENFSAWRAAIEDFLLIYDVPVPDICGLPQLITALNESTACEVFTITHETGVPFAEGDDSELPVNTYSISDGYIYVDKEKVNVAGKTFVAPFYAYLNVSKAADGTLSAELSGTESTTGIMSIGIGGVREVVSTDSSYRCDGATEEEPETTTPVYRMYALTQDNCLPTASSIDLDDIEDLVDPQFGGLEDLILNLISGPFCDVLGIELKSGTPIVTWAADETEPELGTCVYTVRGGTVNVNGKSLYVEGGEDFVAPFRLWVDISSSDSEARLTTVEPGHGWSLGSVELVRSDSDDTNDRYKMYVVRQDSCLGMETFIDFNEPGLLEVTDDGDLVTDSDALLRFEYFMCGVRGLLVALNSESSCDSFKIILISGCPLSHSRYLKLPPCYYEVTGGSVQVNGMYRDVDGLASIQAPFDVYLNFTDYGETIWLSTKEESNSIWLGGVHLVTTEDSPAVALDPEDCHDAKEAEDPEYEEYSMYVLEQGNCMPSIPIMTPLAAESVCGLESLVLALANDSPCEHLRIVHKSGVSMISWLEGEDIPDMPENTYVVKGGTVTLNTRKITVADSAEFTAPFHAYLRLYKDATTGTLKGVVTDTVTDGCYDVGGVTLADTQDVEEQIEYDEATCVEIPGVREPRRNYRMYVISQGNCLTTETRLDFDPDILLETTLSETVCENFKIKLISGSPVCSGSATLDLCTYTVSSGTVIINGVSVHVASQSFTAPFYAYLNLTLSENNVSAALSTSRSETSIGIGGVGLVDTYSLDTTSGRYRMYVIEQGACLSALDVIRTTDSGLLYRRGGVSLLPYTTYPITTCDD